MVVRPATVGSGMVQRVNAEFLTIIKVRNLKILKNVHYTSLYDRHIRLDRNSVLESVLVPESYLLVDFLYGCCGAKVPKWLCV